jgi:hypothetical protein
VSQSGKGINENGCQIALPMNRAENLRKNEKTKQRNSKQVQNKRRKEEMKKREEVEKKRRRNEGSYARRQT